MRYCVAAGVDLDESWNECRSERAAGRIFPTSRETGLSQETALAPMRSFSKHRGAVFALKVAVTVVCFWYVLRQIDVAALRRSLPEFNVLWAFVAVLLIALQIPLIGLRWLEIVDVLKMRGNRLSYLPMCMATAVGQFFGQTLPAAIGDGVRVWCLTRYGSNWRDAAISVIVDRCVGVGVLLVLALAILFLPSRLQTFGGYRPEIILALAGVLLVSLVVLLLGGPLSGAFAGHRSVGWVANFLRSSYRVVFGPRGPLILALGCLVHLLTVVAIWSLGRAQDVALSPADAAALFAVMIGAMLIPVSVGGWGLREFAVVSLFGGYGFGPERALTFSVYFGLVSLVASLPGAVAWLTFWTPQRREMRRSGGGTGAGAFDPPIDPA
jgi:uncharacterized membrane protein YbhN (UPF0104 family)